MESCSLEMSPAPTTVSRAAQSSRGVLGGGRLCVGASGETRAVSVGRDSSRVISSEYLTWKENE